MSEDPISSGILPSLGNVNFNRFVIDSSSGGTATSGVVALENPVVENEYHVWPKLDIIGNEHLSGKQWVFSINVRRLSDSDNADNRDTLLSIALPYYLKGSPDMTSGNIVYDSVAIDTISSQAVMLPFSRGLVMPLHKADSNQSKLFITRRMLPHGSADSAHRDLTISAAFSFKSEAGTLSPNPWIIRSNGGGDTSVYKIGIVVRFHGKGAVAIDWCRIATPDCEALLRGHKDTSVIWHKVKSTLDTMRSYINAGRNYRLLAFYGKDEPDLMSVAPLKYYNALLGGRFTSKGICTGNLLSEGIGCSIRWRESSGAAKHPFVAQPYAPMSLSYLPHDVTGKYYLGLKRGWGSHALDDHLYDSASGSTYETWMKHEFSAPDGYRNVFIKRSDKSQAHSIDSCYPACLSYGPTDLGPLAAIEGGLLELSRNSKVIFDSIPWWEMTSVVVDWDKFASSDSTGTFLAMRGPVRPNTGEEIRQELMTTLALGAKGLTYDRFYSARLDTSNTSSGTYQSGTMVGDGTDQFGGLTGDALINSDTAGSDFLQIPENLTNINHFILLDSVTKHLQVPQSRIYLGRKSQRREIAKIHDFVLNNETLLMNLRLVSWFSKGYRTFVKGDTSALKSILHAGVFDDTDNIATRVLTRPFSRSTVEDIDSTFADITLHRKGSIALDSEFVLCVVNRRTNPIIRDHDTLRFVTTNEFDSLYHNNHVDKYSQGGAREITVPFNFTKGIGVHVDKYVLKIKELSGGDSTIQRVDTLLCPTCPLAATYLPGEAKFFHVTVIPTGLTVAHGAMEYTNQHKLVCAPKVVGYNTLTSQPEYDSTIVRYHLVYHRMDTLVYPTIRIRSKVHYRRSREFHRCSPEDVVDPLVLGSDSVWEVDKVVSDTIRDAYRWLDTSQCRYPSIIVRFDTTDRKEYVYIVYNCEDRKATGAKYSFIAESQFQVMTGPPNSERIYELDTLGGIDNYGQPVANAAKGRNYYAFSEYKTGIVVLGRRTDIGNRSGFATQTLSWWNTIAQNPTGDQADARHPSLNHYSDLNSDTTCALVWQERRRSSGLTPYDSAYDAWQIYYTQLKYDFLSINHYLPSRDTANTQGWEYKSGSDSQIVRPRYCGSTGCNGDWRDRQLPIVLRSHVSIDSNKWHFEKILCHAAKWSTMPCSASNPTTGVLYLTLFTHRACDTCPDMLSPRGNNITYGCGDSIGNVSGVVAQNFTMQTGDSTFVYNLELPQFNMVQEIKSGFLQWGASPPDCFIDNTAASQLSGFPFLSTDFQWTYLRRMANVSHYPINRNITSSVKYLMKGASRSELKSYILRGYQAGKRSLLISDVPEPDVASTLQTSRHRSDEKLGDTLTSNTFKISDSKPVNFLSTGSGHELVNFSVQNLRTGGRAQIDTRMLFKRVQDHPQAARIVFTSGGGDQYRLTLAPIDKLAAYSEEMFLGTTASAFGKLSTDSEDDESEYGGEDMLSLDLSSTWSFANNDRIQVYPNPSDGLVFITVAPQEKQYTYKGEMMTLVIANILGVEVLRQKTIGGETIKFDSSEFPSGVYNVQLVSNSHDVAGSSQVCTRRFVVQR